MWHEALSSLPFEIKKKRISDTPVTIGIDGNRSFCFLSEYIPSIHGYVRSFEAQNATDLRLGLAI